MLSRLLQAVLLALLLPACPGLEITLFRDVPPNSAGRTLCGVLFCVEESNTDSRSNSDQGDTSSTSTISSLTIFKTGPIRTNAKDSNRRQTQIASVTSQNPRIVRVSNGIKVDGQLRDGKASLRLELVKQGDCGAEFTCQVRRTDAQGGEHTSTSHLVQQPGDSKVQVGSLATDTAQKVLNLVQQLDKKVTSMGQIVAQVENSLAKSDRTVAQLENAIENMTDYSVSTLSQLKSAMEINMKQFNDLLSHHQVMLETRAQRFESIASNLKSVIVTAIEAMSYNVTDSFESMKYNVEDKLKSSNDDLLRDFFDKLELTVNGDLNKTVHTVKDALSSGQSKLQTAINRSVKEDRITKQFIQQEIKGAMFNATQDLASHLSDDIASVRSSLESKMQQMFTNSSYCNQENTPVEHNNDDKTNETVLSTFSFKSCYKGMAQGVPQQSPKFIIIQPSQDSSLDTSYLCDTATDGGGWVVIQRRNTGEVNFHRNWARYKKGFGFPSSEFWLGNDNIYSLTKTGTYELRIELKYKKKSTFAHYNTFYIDDESRKYRLHVAGYTGTAGDSLFSDGDEFHTYDRNPAKYNTNAPSGGWWLPNWDIYTPYHGQNLNGKWDVNDSRRAWWRSLSSLDGVTYSEMKIRRVD